MDTITRRRKIFVGDWRGDGSGTQREGVLNITDTSEEKEKWEGRWGLGQRKRLEIAWDRRMPGCCVEVYSAVKRSETSRTPESRYVPIDFQKSTKRAKNDKNGEGWGSQGKEKAIHSLSSWRFADHCF